MPAVHESSQRGEGAPNPLLKFQFGTYDFILVTCSAVPCQPPRPEARALCDAMLCFPRPRSGPSEARSQRCNGAPPQTLSEPRCTSPFLDRNTSPHCSSTSNRLTEAGEVTTTASVSPELTPPPLSARTSPPRHRIPRSSPPDRPASDTLASDPSIRFASSRPRDRHRISHSRGPRRSHSPARPRWSGPAAGLAAARRRLRGGGRGAVRRLLG